MTDQQLEALRKQVEDAQKAILAEEERRKRAAELGISTLDVDTTAMEAKLDELNIHASNQVKLLERLNQVSDQIYRKLEEVSLNLLQVMALGMPLLEKAGK